jgi:hypothetical protein
MTSLTLSDNQRAIVEKPLESKLFLEGPAGTGKTTAAVQRVLHMIDSGVPAGEILILVPQRTLATPYYDAVRQPTTKPGLSVTISTIGGLAQRMVDLLWPLIAEDAGFGFPNLPPIFLTLETAQYYMASLVRPLLDQGYFETVSIDRNRIYSQILDNLNKAAVVGFAPTEIGERLTAAWGGQQSQERIYEEAQACATLFRQHCLAYNLLDFSLQLEVFTEHLWPMPLCRNYLLGTYRHLVVDNVEEDTPVAHDILRDWLPKCESALLVHDQDAGYRRFLGADPESSHALSDLCDERLELDDSFVTSTDLQSFGAQLGRSLHGLPLTDPQDIRQVLEYDYRRYHPEMLDWISESIIGLVHERGVAPGEIVVLAPFLTDSLRFSLMNRLEAKSIPVRSHRPSRALRDEPATQCLLDLAAISHPDWGIRPSRFDIAYALMQAIEGMDLVRAQLLAEIVYRVRDGRPTLTSFDQINPEMKERLTYVLGERFEKLRTWIDEYTAGPPAELDHFLSQLFGELLSQPGYGFHTNYDAGKVTSNLIESVLKFRWVTEGRASPEDKPLGQEYIEMVKDGVVAAQYIRSWQLQAEEAVLLAPAYTFLMANRPVDYQFWIDVGSAGWWERLNQPLTHPYVLSRRWPQGTEWTDGDEFDAEQQALYALTLGLIRRCRHKIYLGLSDLGEHGNEQRGRLLLAIQRILQNLPAEEGIADV